MLTPVKLPCGQEQHEQYYSRILKKNLVQYDYRDHNGLFFSCIAPSLEKAREWRDKWATDNLTALTFTRTVA